jgi:5-methylcytosine-specific restriction enzyme B
MEPALDIAGWHEKLLTKALEWRKANPHFRFSLRTADPSGKTRLSRGYWFPGNERYLFFPVFRLNDPHNKTKTIGFGLLFNRRGQASSTYLNVVFGSVKDEELISTHKKIVERLGPFQQLGGTHKYKRTYAHANPLDAFRQFLSVDYPRIREIIEQDKQAAAFVVTDDDFQEMLNRVSEHRNGERPARGQMVKPVDPGGEELDEPCNLILYGPPGTGKTHWLREKLRQYTDVAREVDREEWLQQRLAEYGWRPVIAAVLAELGRPSHVPAIRAHPWTMAKARERGRAVDAIHATLWSFLQAHTPESVTEVRYSGRRPPFIFNKSTDGLWSLQKDWGEQDPLAAELHMTLRAGPAKDGKEVRRYRLVTFHPSFSYEDFVRGIRPVVDEETGTSRFKIVDGVFKQMCDEARINPGKRYALFIDEINRANISKVFGELITLLEADKRAAYDNAGRQVRGLSVQLPGGSGEIAEEPFGVPANLDVYGTMNTADRSIALLDIALRRRFEFQEMEPDYSVLDEPIGAVDVGRMLHRINDRLEYLLDRDHRIGHAYLMEVTEVDDLRAVFRLQIIPLLQEYFFDDFGRVALVLATAAGAPPFVERRRISQEDLFPRTADISVPAERFSFTLTDPQSWTEASFTGLYGGDPVKPDVQ